MDREEALALFESLTGAPQHVSEHVLDAVGAGRRAGSLPLPSAPDCTNNGLRLPAPM